MICDAIESTSEYTTTLYYYRVSFEVKPFENLIELMPTGNIDHNGPCLMMDKSANAFPEEKDIVVRFKDKKALDIFSKTIEEQIKSPI